MTKHPALRLALAAGALGAAWLLARRFEPVVVAGESMLPILRPGDRLLVDPFAAIEPGAIVVARFPNGVEVVKRVGRIDVSGGIHLAGDNPAASTDSRTVGLIEPHAVTGVVRALWWPPGRARFIAGGAQP